MSAHKKNPPKDGWAWGVGGGGTFDRTLEIIRIMWKLHSQILKSGSDADIMRIIAASK